MKINQRAIKTSLKMTSKAGIFAFTIFGVVVYLLAFFGTALTTTEAMATWKILVGSIGGAIFIAVLIMSVLRFSRYIIMKLSESSTNF